jgi:hypothetical protein
MDQDHQVYDDDNSAEPVTGPNLHALESGDDNNEPASDEGRTKRKSGKAKSKGAAGYSPGGGLFNADDGSPVEGPVAAALAGAEARNDGFKFNPNDPKDRGNMKMVLRGAGKHKKAFLIGGGATTGIVGLIVVVFFMLIPLKIEHIVSKLESRFTSTSQNAVENASERMLSIYIKKHVLPALTKCSGTTLDRNCNPHFGNTTNPVDAMYKGWSNARLENKLATKYGIEFKAVRHGSQVRYYMKAPGVGNPAGDDITKFAGDDKNLFQQVSRGEARSYVRQSFASESRWKQVMFRFKVGRLLEEKYGIKRCIAFCGTKDALQEFSGEKKNAAKLFLTQRVISPRTESLGVVMECLLDTSCNPEDTQPTTPEDGTSGELSGEPENPQTDTKVRQKMVELAGTYGITDKAAIDKMLQDYKSISDKGYSKYLLDKVLEKIGLSAISDQVSSAVPVVGWITKGAQLITTANKLGPSVRKLGYVVNMGAAVQLYSMYRTEADEVHTGKVNATELGSFNDSLGPGNHGSPSDPVVGGTASAESSPLYGAIIDDKSGGTPTSVLDSLLPSRAYADTGASTASNDYRCNDGSTVPKGKLVCPEEQFGQGSAALDGLHNTLNSGPLAALTAAAKPVALAAKIPGDALGPIIGAIPGIGSLTNAVNGLISPAFHAIVSQVIPNPFGTNMGGGRNFNMMAAGAAGVGAESCNQVGCQSVPVATAAAITSQQESENQQQFSRQPLFARLFDTSSDYSLVSRVALSVPFGKQTAVQNSVGSLITRPWDAIAGGFSSLFSTKRVFAASTASIDPFNIGTSAFPANKIPDDPEAYWTAHNCGDTSSNGPIAKWQKAASDGPKNPATGMPVHTDVEPCLLIKNAVGDAGGIYDTGTLSSDEQSVLNGNLTSSQL